MVTFDAKPATRALTSSYNETNDVPTNKYAEQMNNKVYKGKTYSVGTWDLDTSKNYMVTGSDGCYNFKTAHGAWLYLTPETFDVNGNATYEGNEISFIVFVANGCELVYDLQSVDTPEAGYYWTNVSIDKNDVETMEMEGYYPVNVTLTINENWVGETNIKTNVAWANRNSVPFYVESTNVSAFVS